ncbi:schizont membrane associated cytoadherence protein, putative [Plasmodium vinckei vinckei]|uniref:Schizont membrane associated cytoadherence protein, putative n=1 Tax=Plasmodium vinckei vinckei TaxID=54757 RepID=A0A081I998_PLAVN|nr:schizont membrane associated cytoadherence protein, putative [Plasmodium vinckei vinckei]KEG00256.1 hypothetical protein YYE_04767 [Plasmodium vinckei vinckei]VEV54409.1 schizont membrane associated cytoadherence protein, putative [Plasmodium vinckei vinckei]
MKYLAHLFFFITFLQFIINKYDNNDKALGKFLNIRNGRFLADYYYNSDEDHNQHQKKKKAPTYAPNTIPQNGTTFPNIRTTQNTASDYYPQPIQGHQKNTYDSPAGFDFYNSPFIVKLRHNAKLIMASSAVAFFLIEDIGIKAMLFLIFASAALAYFTSI